MRNCEALISSLMLLLSLSEVAAWSILPPVQVSSSTSTVTKSSLLTRKDFVKAIILSTIGVSTAEFVGEGTTGLHPQYAYAAEETIPIAKPGSVVNLPNGVSYTVIKSGTGPLPDRGELIAVRFVAYCGDNKLDDVMDTREPYYTRVGSGGLIRGVEETIPLMRLGDRWKMTIPVSLCKIV
jgi:FKBP-type peptidyl-prolyl cis-trans isomerase